MNLRNIFQKTMQLKAKVLLYLKTIELYLTD